MEVLIVIGAIVVLVLLILSLIYFGLKFFLRSDKNENISYTIVDSCSGNNTEPEIECIISELGKDFCFDIKGRDDEGAL